MRGLVFAHPELRVDALLGEPIRSFVPLITGVGDNLNERNFLSALASKIVSWG